MHYRLQFQKYDDFAKIFIWKLIAYTYRHSFVQLFKRMTAREHYLDLNTQFSNGINRMTIMKVGSVMSIWYCVYLLELNAFRFREYMEDKYRRIDFVSVLDFRDFTQDKWDVIQYSMVSLFK